MKTLELLKPMPHWIIEELDDYVFIEECGHFRRQCKIFIPEKYAFTHIHPESFDFSDVFGECEFCQIIEKEEITPVFVLKFEWQKDFRSFEEEAERQNKSEILEKRT